jgi:hypothetical protein
MIRLKQNNAENDSCCDLREFSGIVYPTSSGEPIIEYYDDEELDVFRHYAPDAYSAEEIEQFREVLYTLLKPDVPGWIHSLHLREINLPDILKEEAIAILSGNLL